MEWTLNCCRCIEVRAVRSRNVDHLGTVCTWADLGDLLAAPPVCRSQQPHDALSQQIAPKPPSNAVMPASPLLLRQSLADLLLSGTIFLTVPQ